MPYVTSDKVNVYSSGTTQKEQHAAYILRKEKRKQQVILRKKILANPIQYEKEKKAKKINPTARFIGPIMQRIAPFEKLLQEVAKKHGVDKKEIATEKRTRDLVNARREISYRGYFEEELSLSHIGRMMNRDHSTIHHSANEWARLIKIKKGNHTHLLLPHDSNFNWDLIEIKD